MCIQDFENSMQPKTYAWKKSNHTKYDADGCVEKQTFQNKLNSHFRWFLAVFWKWLDQSMSVCKERKKTLQFLIQFQMSEMFLQIYEA